CRRRVDVHSDDPPIFGEGPLMLHDPAAEKLFPMLPDAELAELEKYGEILEFNDGDVLFSEGQTEYPFYLVMEGRVKVTKKFGNEVRSLAVHDPGSFSGEISMLTGDAAIATGTAVGHVRALRVQSDDLRRLLLQRSNVSRIL